MLYTRLGVRILLLMRRPRVVTAALTAAIGVLLYYGHPDLALQLSSASAIEFLRTRVSEGLDEDSRVEAERCPACGQ